VEPSVALILAQYGDLEAALAMNARGLALAREVGMKRAIANTFETQSLILLHAGRLAEAQRALAEGQRLSRELGFDVRWAILETRKAVMDLEEGDARGAEASVREAIARLEKPASDRPTPGDLGAARATLARVLLAEGRVVAARAEIDRAAAI